MIYLAKSVVFLLSVIILFNKCNSITHPKRQMRSGWIASVANIDWPSRPGLPIEEQKTQFVKLVNEAKADNLNSLIVQIRPTADSFYPSKLFPWSQWLTGKQGLSPGYDPLKFMVEQTHGANLEFHAWLNPYRISVQTDLKQLSPDNPAIKYPDWVIKYGNILVFNPGLPEVREYIMSGILEVIQNYDIDGIHFDDYFYPYPVKGVEFEDNSTYIRFGLKDFKHISDWRRNNTNVLIEELHKRIKNMNPHIKFGVSPFGVWRNIDVDPTGSNTTAGVQCYDDLYADTRTWITKEWIDYIVPQLYWLIGFKPAAYDVLVEWWDREVNNTNVQLYVGHSVARVGSNSSGWLNPRVIEEQMELNTRYLNVKGSVFWNMHSMILNKLNFKNILKSNSLSKPALVPLLLPESHSFNESVFIKNAIKKSNSTVELIWTLQSSYQSNMTSYFVIYRFDGLLDRTPNISTADNIEALVRFDANKVEQNFIDHNVIRNQTYYISAVTRYHIEGLLSPSIHLIIDK